MMTMILLISLHGQAFAQAAVAPVTPTKEHYLGLGLKRSKELLTFPFRHPVLAFNKGTYPIRHPAKFYENYGHFMEPYQPANDATASLANMGSTVGIFTVLRH
jgi:hypothetical protein